ncbi:hypothetical protein ACW910_09530 (plasmid) [Burkholderia ambifaria]
MRSPWNNVIAVLDADTLRVWTNDGWRARRAGEPHVVVAHDGLPAEALAQVLGGLPKARLPMRNRVHVVVGHPWTHGVVLPWQDGLVSDAAWDAYARALFAARAQRGALRIRIEAGPRGRARLAVAACDTLLAALAAVTRAAGWRLVSVRDALSGVARRACRPPERRRLPLRAAAAARRDVRVSPRGRVGRRGHAAARGRPAA